MGWIRIAPNTIRISLEGTAFSKPFVNVLHYRAEIGDFDLANITLQTIAVRDAWQSEILDFFPNQYTFTGGVCMSLDSSTTTTFPFSPNTGLPVVGTDTQVTPSANVATLVHKASAAGPRGFKGGRMYLPPPPNVQMGEDGQLASGQKTLVQGKLNAFFDATTGPGVGGEWSMCVPSWPGLGEPPTTPTPVVNEANVTVSGLVLDPLVATQRRRLR